MKLTKKEVSTYGISDLKDVKIINNVEIDFLGVFVAAILVIIAWELLNKSIYVPPYVWSMIYVLLVLGVILVIVVIITSLVSIAVFLYILRRL